MRVEVMQYYSLTNPLTQAGYYETETHKQLTKDIRAAIFEGRLIALCGVVGCGKTVTLRRLQQLLREENRVTVAKSLSVEKSSIKLATLISALFYDLVQDKAVQIPKQGERRERELQELVKKGKRPVALFVDEAHDLNGHTLIGLKRLMEVVEEIGYRTEIFTLDGIVGSQREYIQWLLAACTEPQDDAPPILTEEAIDLLATKLRTPLQVQQHVTLVLEAGYLTGERPITAELVDSVLSRKLDDLEPTLTRHGYRLKDMVEQFDAKPAEIRALFNHQLDPTRTAELRDRILAAGLPI